MKPTRTAKVVLMLMLGSAWMAPIGVIENAQPKKLDPLVLDELPKKEKLAGTVVGGQKDGTEARTAALGSPLSDTSSERRNRRVLRLVGDGLVRAGQAISGIDLLVKKNGDATIRLQGAATLLGEAALSVAGAADRIAQLGDSEAAGKMAAMAQDLEQLADALNEAAIGGESWGMAANALEKLRDYLLDTR